MVKKPKYNYIGKAQRNILKLVENKPIFFEETGIDKNHVIRASRQLKLVHNKDILWYNHKAVGQGHNHKKKIPNFLIIFKSTQRIEAWKRLIKRFPEINKSRMKWIMFGKPVLDGLIVHEKVGGKKHIKGENLRKS